MSTYDVRIWEEIRTAVRWKMGQLVESIGNEVSKDDSLSEFQGSGPIPWQLREIMEQRAHVWVQRVYDLCCNAHRSACETPSVDFDRAVWAYCVEPFIMGAKESDIHKLTTSGLLELLLCAVGSTPGKRNLLTVSRKQSCFDVRKKVYEIWCDKLHHLPPRINEAAAAMARFNAMERRAARIVRGLPPDDPAPESLAAPALTQTAVSGPAQDPPVPASGTVSASPLSNPVQEGTATADLPRDTTHDVHDLSSNVGAVSWGSIELVFLSDERVQIRNNGKSETRNYAELGFEDGRTGKPTNAWEALRELAKRGGVIKDPKIGNSWAKTEKRVQEMRRVLRKQFGIAADPIPFVGGVGYKTSFKIGCGPSFDT